MVSIGPGNNPNLNKITAKPKPQQPEQPAGCGNPAAYSFYRKCYSDHIGMGMSPGDAAYWANKYTSQRYGANWNSNNVMPFDPTKEPPMIEGKNGGILNPKNITTKSGLDMLGEMNKGTINSKLGSSYTPPPPTARKNPY